MRFRLCAQSKIGTYVPILRLSCARMGLFLEFGAMGGLGVFAVSPPIPSGTDNDACDARPEPLLDKIPVSKMSNLSNVSISS